MPSCCTPRFPVRSPKEFLAERKRHLEKTRERKETVSDNPASALSLSKGYGVAREIEFIDFVIERIDKEALITEKTEKEIISGLDWKWWIESDEENWESFADIMSSFRKSYWNLKKLEEIMPLGIYMTEHEEKVLMDEKWGKIMDQSPKEQLFHLLEKEGITEEMIQRAIDVPEIREKIVECWKIQENAYLTMLWWKARCKAQE